MRYCGNKICPEEQRDKCGRRTADNIMPLLTLSSGGGLKIHYNKHETTTEKETTKQSMYAFNQPTLE